MKVAIVADPIYPVPPRAYGGTERMIFYLIKGLVEAIEMIERGEE